MGKTEEVDAAANIVLALIAKIATMMTLRILEPLDQLQVVLAEEDVLWKASTETS